MGTIKVLPRFWFALSLPLVIDLASSLVLDTLVRGSDGGRGTLVVECSVRAILESGRESDINLRTTVPHTGRLRPPCPTQLSPVCV